MSMVDGHPPGAAAAARAPAMGAFLGTSTDVYRRYGARAAAVHVACRLGERLVDGRVLVAHVLSIPDIPAKFLADSAGFRLAFLTLEEMHRQAQALGAMFDPGNIDALHARGDRCFGVFDGERLASFGWYSRRATAVTEGTSIRFDPRYAYMYKGYTDSAYRGKSLYALGIAHAAVAYAAEGCKGLVSFVFVNNFAALAASAGLGYRVIGHIWTARPLGRTWIRNDPQCARLGVELHLTAP